MFVTKRRFDDYFGGVPRYFYDIVKQSVGAEETIATAYSQKCARLIISALNKESK